MTCFKYLATFLLFFETAFADNAAGRYPAGVPADIPGAERFIYKEVGDFQLPAFVFSPETAAEHNERSGAVVFFHGSGWKSGSIRQFETQARLLSDHGLAAVLAEYRVKEGYGATPFDGIRDAKSVIRWLRANAARFNIHPGRIAAAGASAGGHIVLAASVFENQFNDPADPPGLSAIPNALILFSTVVDTTEAGYTDEDGLALFKGKGEKFSPARNLRKGMPPIIIMHGTDDKWIPYGSIERFAEAMGALGNDCEPVPFQDRGHHFYNSTAYLEQRPHLRTETSRTDFVISFYLMERFLFEQENLEKRPAVPAFDAE